MAHQGPPSLCSTLQANKIRKSEVVRQTAGFHPTVWGDHFLNYSVEDKNVDAWTRKVEVLKEEVRKMLVNAKGSVQEMILINDIQRLGVAYQFEKEIDEALSSIYDAYTNVHYDDLLAVALRFQLLREAGFNVSSDVFRKFKDDDGNFKATLSSHVRGMLCLYEAAYFGIQGEEILDEAIVFTSGHLNSIMPHLHHPLVAKVQRALELPMRKRILRLEARYYISLYQDEESHNDVLLELARLDFNILQSLHQTELKDLCRWWKDLGLATKYPFARDRLVEGYFWVLGVYFEPQYTCARAILTKIFKILSIMDDIYDTYSTLDELETFTNAIHRSELEAAEGLPDYMKACYLALLNTLNAIEGQMMPDEKVYRTNYIKREMKAMVQGYLDEAKWANKRHVPTLGEHLDVSLVTAGNRLLVGVTYAGMGDLASKEVFDWLNTHPKFIMDLNIIGRLVDDIVGHQAHPIKNKMAPDAMGKIGDGLIKRVALRNTSKTGKAICHTISFPGSKYYGYLGFQLEFEQERMHAASTVECYMKDHGVSEQEACAKLQEMVATAWKDLNKACLRPTVIPLPLLLPAIGLVRVVEDLYIHGDGYTDSRNETKEKVIMVLVDPIPIPMRK